VLIATAGAMHLAHVVIDEAKGSDFTGVLALAGGLLLIGLSVAGAWVAPRRDARAARGKARARGARLARTGLFRLVPDRRRHLRHSYAP
jgi:hypothetical protein